MPYVPAQKWGRDLNLQSLAGIYAAKSQRTLHTVSYYYIHSSKYKGLGTKKKKSFFLFHNSEKDNLLEIEIPNEIKMLHDAWAFFLNQTIE